MFKREIKINLKSYIVWLLSLIVLFSIVYLVYPSIENNKEINEMLKHFLMNYCKLLIWIYLS